MANKGRLPEGWQWVKLGDIYDLQMGKTPSRAVAEYWRDGTNKWISIADLTTYDKYTSDTKEKITDKAVKVSGVKYVPENTLIISFKLSLGKTAITTEQVYTNEAIMAFFDKGVTQIHIDYVYYYFLFKNWYAGTNFAVKGATLNKESLSNIEIPLPPLSEQRRIAAIIETQLAAVDKAKKAAAEQQAAAGALVEAFVAETLNDKSYRQVKINDVCIVNPTTKGKLKDLDNEMRVTFVPMPAVSAEMGAITAPEVKTLKEVRKGFTYFENNDVLFAKITPCMQNGKHAIARNLNNGIGFGSTEFHVIKPGQDVLPEWIHYFLRQSKYLRYAENYLQGAVGQQRLPDDILKETLIPLPSIKEQKKKIDALAIKLNKLNQINSSMQEQSAYINAMPAAILRKAFAGDM